MPETHGEPIPIQPFDEVDNLPNRKRELVKKLSVAHGKYGTLANPYWRAATDKAARIELLMQCKAEPENHDASRALETQIKQIERNKLEVDGYKDASKELEDDMDRIASMHFRARKTANPDGDIRIEESDSMTDQFLVDQVRKISKMLTEETLEDSIAK